MREQVLGKSVSTSMKTKETELKALFRPTASLERAEEKQPQCALTHFVTEILRRSKTSISVLQVALAYLAGAKREYILVFIDG